MVNKRGRYTTWQQNAVSDFMQSKKDYALTVDEVFEALQLRDQPVGKSTVYRALERLSQDGFVVSIPDKKSGCVRYCYLDNSRMGTCLVCNHCHHVFALNCSSLNGFNKHIELEHHFKVEFHQTLLFGLCKECSLDV